MLVVTGNLTNRYFWKSFKILCVSIVYRHFFTDNDLYWWNALLCFYLLLEASIIL